MVRAQTVVLWLLLVGCFEANYDALALGSCNKPSDCDRGLVCVATQCVRPAEGYQPETPHCGDGIVSGDEACDDGNDDPTDACLDDCRAASCGDGIVRGHLAADDPAYEACDDGNEADDDACLSNCVSATCGDGLHRSDLAAGAEGYEACDDGNDDQHDACLPNCQLARCGDGVLRSDLSSEGNPAYEACDDGNEADDDACLSNCVSATCGDGVRRTDLASDHPEFEECDDGNAQAGADCEDCRIARIDFSARSIQLAAAEAASSFALGDFGGERGLPDLMFANTVSVWDPGAYLAPSTTVAALFPERVHRPALIDVDGDGALEVLVGERNSHGFRFYEFAQDGGLTPVRELFGTGSRTDSEFYSFAKADVDGDGREEALGISPDAQASLFSLQSGDNLDFSRQDFPCGTHTKGGFAHINGDERPDVYVICDGGTLHWFLYTEAGFGVTADGTITVSGLGETNGAAALDVHGDGLDDLVVIRRRSNHSSDGDLVLVRNGADGFDQQEALTEGVTVWRGVLAADLNGDGRDDLVGYGEGGARWWQQNAEGLLVPQEAITSSNLAHLEAADLDGDFDVDLIGTDEQDLHLFINNRIAGPEPGDSPSP